MLFLVLSLILFVFSALLSLISTGEVWRKGVALGGTIAGSPAVQNGADSTVPVDLYIAGCPPHPLTILDGFLRLLGRLENGRRGVTK